MKIINLTPHDVVIRLDDGTEKAFPAIGEMARVNTTAEVVEEVDGIPIVSQSFGEIEGLPEKEKGTLYIVSLVTRQAAQELGRTDVISPDTSPAGAIRDEQGRIVAVRRFVR